MGLSRLEQETIIKFNAEEKGIEIYTAYPPMMRKLANSPDYEKVREYKALYDAWYAEMVARTTSSSLVGGILGRRS